MFSPGSSATNPSKIWPTGSAPYTESTDAGSIACGASTRTRKAPPRRGARNGAGPAFFELASDESHAGRRARPASSSQAPAAPPPDRPFSARGTIGSPPQEKDDFPDPRKHGGI